MVNMKFFFCFFLLVVIIVFSGLMYWDKGIRIEGWNEEFGELGIVEVVKKIFREVIK